MLGIAALVALAALPPFLSSYNAGLLSLALIYAIAAMAQTVLSGTANQPSLASAAFLLVGAYVSASFTTDLHLPFAVAGLLAVVLTTVVGFAVGLPALRIRGVNLAVATLALVFVTPEVLRSLDTYLNRVGPMVSRPPLLATDRNLYYAALSAAAAVTLILRLALRSDLGKAWLALKDSETAAISSGVKPSRYKTLAFALSAGVTGLAGVLLAQYDSGVTESAFGLELSLAILSMAVIGGLGSLPGAYLGAFLITLLKNVLDAFPTTLGPFQIHSSTTLVSGVLLLLTLLLLPGGLWSAVTLARDSVAMRLPRGPGLEP
jgi:branched-chain amino acid transport system permease protein